MDIVLYVHGRGGNADEAEHYKPLFPSCEVIGLDYMSTTPWDAGEEISQAVRRMSTRCKRIYLVANSIGAFFCMNADIGKYIDHAWFISPVVDMEKLITGMINLAGVTESELEKKQTIRTDFGEELSWEYLCYVRRHPVEWDVPTDILYGSKDNLTSIKTITDFSAAHNARLTVMENGEHWFHTEQQMLFLDNWIKNDQ